MAHQRSRKKRSKWLPAIATLVVAGVLFGGWQALGPAKERYRVWKQQRALAQAKEFIEKNDPANAQIALELALTTSPNSPEAWRLAAEMLESVNAPQAMRLRRRVVEMKPDSIDDRVALVMSALKFNDINAAKDAIEGMSFEQGATLPALRAQLAYAVATDNAPIADAIYDEIAKFTPNDDSLKVAHSFLRLRSPNPKTVNAAQQNLEAFRENPQFRRRINRELFTRALQANDVNLIKEAAHAVAADPEASLIDRLHVANVAILIEKRPFETVYKEIEPAVPLDAESGVLYVQWLLSLKKTTEAREWMKRLPEEVRTQPAIKRLIADAVALDGDWDQLAELLVTGAWGSIKPETVRLAMSARLLKEDASTLRKDMWEEVLRSAGANLAALNVLYRLGNVWGWELETERTLWTIARMFPDQTWAHQRLFNHYRANRNTAEMRNVMTALRESDPSVKRYQHDWALLTLLTDPSNTWNPAKEMMKQLHSEAPGNAAYAVGYAFALAQANRADEALELIKRLSAVERELVTRAPYMAYIYGMNGQTAEVERYERVGKDENFLPQERALFSQAKALSKAVAGGK